MAALAPMILIEEAFVSSSGHMTYEVSYNEDCVFRLDWRIDSDS